MSERSPLKLVPRASLPPTTHVAPLSPSEEYNRALFARFGIPVSLSNTEIRAYLAPQPVADPVYMDDPEPPTPPFTAALIIAPALGFGYVALHVLTSGIRLAKRGLLVLDRKCNEADQRVTPFGLLCVAFALGAAFTAVCFLYAGGGQ